MPANGLPALPPRGCAIEHEVGDDLAALASCAKANNGQVPYHLSRLQRFNVALSDSFALPIRA